MNAHRDNYFETLADCVAAVVRRLEEVKAVVADPDFERKIGEAPVNYGCRVRHDFRLASLNGKETRLYVHVGICRMDSGRYELVFYIL